MKTVFCFWQRFHIVVLGIAFFLSAHFFQFLFGLLFSFFLWTFIFPFLFGLLFPFSLWTFISLFSLDFYFPFSLLTFIQSRSLILDSSKFLLCFKEFCYYGSFWSQNRSIEVLIFGLRTITATAQAWYLLDMRSVYPLLYFNE